MFYGINMPAFGDFADPHALAALAVEAEKVGWDGFFVWDHLFFDPSFHPMLDPWIGLAAVALRTHTLRLGTMITPLPRRRPWKLARECVSLDHLSHGRLTLGVGIGDPVQWDFGFFGEATDAKLRAEQLDEGLDILSGLWSGEPFCYQGKHYQIEEVRFRPPPQQPHIPIWVGGWWPNKPPMRRAARWDGVCPGTVDQELTPNQWQELLAYIGQYRTNQSSFDAVHTGRTSGTDKEADTNHVAKYTEVGVTWWIEDVSPWRFGWDWEAQWSNEATKLMQQRVRQGPPGKRFI